MPLGMKNRATQITALLGAGDRKSLEGQVAFYEEQYGITAEQARAFVADHISVTRRQKRRHFSSRY